MVLIKEHIIMTDDIFNQKICNPEFRKFQYGTFKYFIRDVFNADAIKVSITRYGYFSDSKNNNVVLEMNYSKDERSINITYLSENENSNFNMSINEDGKVEGFLQEGVEEILTCYLGPENNNFLEEVPAIKSFRIQLMDD